MNRRLRFAFSSLTSFALVVAVETVASAAPSPSTKPYADGFDPPTGSLPPHPGAHLHDGFYLRLSLGAGLMLLDRSAETSAPSSAREFADSRVSGPTIPTEISIGGTPLPGLVVAGSLLSHNHPGPDLERDDGMKLDLGDRNMVFMLLGGTVDYYPRPSRGLHVGGTLGILYGVGPSPSVFGQIGGLGPGLSGFVGHDFWLTEDWSAGPVARIMTAYLTADHQEGNLEASEDSLFLAISVMISLVRH